MKEFNQVFYEVLEKVLNSFSVPKGLALLRAFYISLGITLFGIVSWFFELPILIQPIGAVISNVVLLAAVVLEKGGTYAITKHYGLQFRINHAQSKPASSGEQAVASVSDDAGEEHTDEHPERHGSSDIG